MEGENLSYFEVSVKRAGGNADLKTKRLRLLGYNGYPWFVNVNFSVMFTNFGHIHSVILIWSCKFPSY